MQQICGLLHRTSSTNSMRSFILLSILARVRIMRSARSFTPNMMMGYCRIGPVKLFFCNPPYGRSICDWVKKCYEESRKPGTIVVALIPARTDTRYFHEFIYRKAKEIRFIRGRLKFGGAKNNAPFPSMVVVFWFMRLKGRKKWKSTDK